MVNIPFAGRRRQSTGLRGLHGRHQRQDGDYEYHFVELFVAVILVMT